LTKKTHIVFLASWYPSRVLPLNGDFIQRHAEAVASLYQVSVLHVITDPKATKSISISDEVINNVRTLIAYIKPSKWKIVYYIKAYRLLLKRLDTIAVFHVNKLFPVGMIAVLYKWFTNINYIISEHHHIYHAPYNKRIGKVQKVLSKLITRNAKYVCPVSDDLGNAMQAYGLSGNYHKVPNVIFTKIFTPKESQNNTLFTLLHVSNMSKLKNVELILETIAALQKQIPKFTFYLLGKKSHEFKEMAHDLGIRKENIVFVGGVSQQELATYYKKADVFLLFSSIETFSCVIYESLSSGTPVISTNVGGIQEHFPKAYGHLVPQGDTKALLKGILAIYKQKDHKHPIQMHQYISNQFSPQSIAKQFSELYQLIIKGKEL
jgi:glycosyltransferase involved in cell wall biosynthesis